MLQARHEEQGKCFLFFEVLSFDAMILAEFLNYLGVSGFIRDYAG